MNTLMVPGLSDLLLDPVLWSSRIQFDDSDGLPTFLDLVLE